MVDLINRISYYYKFLSLYMRLIQFIYNKAILLGIISKLYNIHGTSMIKAITIGNNIVQQKDIN